jgi:hypothetical protein
MSSITDKYFGSLQNIRDYCWVFKFGAMMSLVKVLICVLIVVFIFITPIKELQKRFVKQTAITQGVLGTIAGLFWYIVFRVLYTMCART